MMKVNYCNLQICSLITKLYTTTKKRLKRIFIQHFLFSIYKHLDIYSVISDVYGFFYTVTIL